MQTQNTNSTSIEKSPHDEFFKESFSYKEVVKALIKHFLPLHIFKKFDWRTLKPDKTDYLTNQFKKYYSDVVYSIQYKTLNATKIHFIFLFEHKSKIDKIEGLLIQLLTYILELYNTDLKNQQNLKFVLPIVISHDLKKWKYLGFRAYFANLGIDEELLDFAPNFKTIFTDVPRMTDEEIDKLDSNILKIAFFLFKYVKNEELLAEKLTDVFGHLNKESEDYKKLRFLLTSANYLIKSTDIESNLITEAVNSTKIKQKIMTTYLRLKQEGKDLGIENFLVHTDFKPSKIAKMFDVTVQYVLAIKQKLESKH